MSEWTTLGKLEPGTLFERRDGEYSIKTVWSDTKSCQCVTIDGTGLAVPFSADLEVCPIDLPFLLICVQDKLAESDAYQRGLHDGAERMRERAAVLSETKLVMHGDQYGGHGATSEHGEEIAAAIRYMPLAEEPT